MSRPLPEAHVMDMGVVINEAQTDAPLSPGRAPAPADIAFIRSVRVTVTRWDGALVIGVPMDSDAFVAGYGFKVDADEGWRA